MRIEFTRAILLLLSTLKFSEKFDHPFSHIFIFDNTFPESAQFRCYLILYGVGVRCDVDTFKLFVRTQSIYREAYDYINIL